MGWKLARLIGGSVRYAHAGRLCRVRRRDKGPAYCLWRWRHGREDLHRSEDACRRSSGKDTATQLAEGHIHTDLGSTITRGIDLQFKLFIGVGFRRRLAS